jgi:hypothetical protein
MPSRLPAADVPAVVAGRSDAASSWTRPSDVRAAVRRRWESGVLLGRFATGQEWEPLSIPLRGPASGQIGDRLEDVRRWAAEWTHAALGPLRVEYKQVGGRHFGVNTLPCRAWLDSYADTWTLLNVGREVRRLAELAGAADGVGLSGWLTAHPMRALRFAEEWDKLLATVRWIGDRQVAGMYLRQIDVPGVDTKFVERHKGILAELLDATLDSSRIDAAGPDFAGRYRFARKPAQVRFRVASTICGFSELTVRVSEFAAPPAGIARVYIVENEITYLAFPLPATAMTMLGGGYAVSVLAPLRWLAGLDVVYWGDLDTHGFAILNQLRQHVPNARSLLMDRDTLLDHQAHWSTEPSPTSASLGRLTEAESAVYADIVSHAHAPSIRLEQERIRFSAVERAVAASLT